MKAIETLIRMHRRLLDETISRRTEIERARDEIIERAAQLERDIENESKVAADSYEANHAFAGYLAHVRSQQRVIVEEIAAFDEAVEQASENVAAAFRDLKKHEITLEMRQQREAAEEARREQIELDEMGSRRHHNRRLH